MRFIAIFGITFVMLFSACKKQTIELNSTIFIGSNSNKIIRSYIVRDVYDTTLLDNLGKTSYLFKRSIRNTIDSTKWDLLLTYRVSIDSSKISVIENNLRFIKLVSPLREGQTWKGNSFINTNENTGLSYLEGWEYTYGKTNESQLINRLPFNETITVFQKNDTIGNPFDRKLYSSIVFSKEIYAKEVGLVYKELLKQTWQPPNSNNPNGYFEEGSFGIKLTILSFSK
jgi:hypothetical protein